MDKNQQTESNILNQNITDTLEKNYMPYAMSVIVSRAIPEIDGFKPSHRKLLFTMYKMGLLTGSRTKSANVVGQTMKLNPHGDSAIYETMVRLTRGNEALLHAYVDSKGNFGRHYSRDMQYAASRYTEVRLEKICEEIFRGLDKNSVDFIDNYDSSTKEPVLLPCTFPSILINSNQGIAVGMASNICSFNLKEICEAAIALMKDETADLLKIITGPDFSCGGQLLYNGKEMENVYHTGRGSFKIRSVYGYDKKANVIEIKEIPYTTTAENIIDEITELVKSGKIKEINDVRDETDLSGLKITIDCKRGVDPDGLMTKLFRFTRLEDTFSCNFNVLIDGKPQVLGIKALLLAWISWRQICLEREVGHDLNKKRERLHLLEGLAKILLNIDKAIAIIRETELESEVVPNLIKGFEIDQIQAEYVAEIKLRNINKQYILNRTKDISLLEEEIQDLENILKSPARINKLIIKDLEAVIKKYARPRLTQIIDQSEAEFFQAENLIEDYKLKIFVTEHGYIKKIPLTSLRSAGDLKTKEDDQIILELEGKNKSDLLFFSNFASVYKIKAFELVDSKPSELGHFFPNILAMEENEKILHVCMTDSYEGEILFAFTNGKIARIPLQSYETKTNRKKLIKACSDLSPLVKVAFLPEPSDLVVYSNLKKVVVLESHLIPLKTTRTSQGVQVISSKKASTLTNLEFLKDSLLNDPEYYRIRRIPAVGYYLKEGSEQYQQIQLGDL